MHRIRIAVKCSQKPEDLDRFVGLAEDLEVGGLEVCELRSLMDTMPLKERAARIVRRAKKSITHLCFHQPLWRGTFEEMLLSDLAASDNRVAMRYAEETVLEAIETGLQIGTGNAVLVNVHIIGYGRPEDASLREKLIRLQRGEAALRTLNEFADRQCFESGFILNGKPQVVITRENNTVSAEEEFVLIIDSHPNEFARVAEQALNIDVAHFQMYLEYARAKNGEHNAAADLDLELYPRTSWPKMIRQTKNMIRLFHLNDASGCRLEDEGVVIGTGRAPFKKIIPLLCENLPEDALGTIEIKDQHVNPQHMVDSILYLRKLFGKDYDRFFF